MGMKKAIDVLSGRKVILGIYVGFALLAAVQQFLLEERPFVTGGPLYTHFNNYVIFKESFFHLISNRDLYQLYPEAHHDLYKYSPTFSLFFGFFAIFPDIIGLVLWDLLNALVLLFAVYYLPVLNLRQKGLVLLASSVEMLTSVQNSQSNALIAGLIVLAFGLLERRHYLWACLCLVFTVYIKIFGLVAMAIYLFYPGKARLAAYTLIWSVVLWVLPLAVVHSDQLVFLYKSWWNMLSEDHSASLGLSVMGWIESWFKVAVNKQLIVLAGVLLFLAPLWRYRGHSQDFWYRFSYLCSVLIWIVIFNHKAESPTFIVAMTGAALWYFTSPSSRINTVLFATAFVLTSLSPTDIFPRFVRVEWVQPFVLKAVPCILIWGKLIWDTVRRPSF